MNAPTDAQPIKIYTLGRFEIVLDGKLLRFVYRPPRKPLALLKGLLCARGQAVSNEVLCEALWPDLEPWSATRALNATTFRLRRLLGHKDALASQDGRVHLNPELCWVDAWAFEDAVESAQADSLAAALGSYQGMFLGDADHPLAFAARERLCRKFIRAVLQVGSKHERAGNWHSARLVYESALDRDCTSEAVYLALMRCLAHEGESSAVAATYQRCRRVLWRHFGTVPSAPTEQFYRSTCKGQGHQGRYRGRGGERRAEGNPGMGRRSEDARPR